MKNKFCCNLHIRSLKKLCYRNADILSNTQYIHFPITGQCLFCILLIFLKVLINLVQNPTCSKQLTSIFLFCFIFGRGRRIFQRNIYIYVNIFTDHIYFYYVWWSQIFILVQFNVDPLISYMTKSYLVWHALYILEFQEQFAKYFSRFSVKRLKSKEYAYF